MNEHQAFDENDESTDPAEHPVVEKYSGVTTKNTRFCLTDRELFLHRSQVVDFIDWLDKVGKNPKRAQGYAEGTVRTTIGHIDRFYRWIWRQEQGYTAPPTHNHADDFIEELARRDDVSNHYRSNMRKALLRYFRWRARERGGGEWTNDLRFKTEDHQPKDFLTAEERGKIRQAALVYGNVPEMYDVPREEEQDAIDAYLAQRFEVPKEAIDEGHRARVNSWLIVSLVWTSLDTGLRPVEVRRARTSWVDTENQVLRIPVDESSKNADNWTVGIQGRTAEALRRWLAERRKLEEYHGNSNLWLTIQDNEYSPAQLRRLLQKLCDIADIDYSDRSMSWYTIRHSVGTYMTREEGLAAAQAQLRHRTPLTTMKYDQAPVEDRIDALDRMG